VGIQNQSPALVGRSFNLECSYAQLQTVRVMFRTSEPSEHSRERGFNLECSSAQLQTVRVMFH
jgi:hypothetical protein